MYLIILTLYPHRQPLWGVSDYLQSNLNRTPHAHTYIHTHTPAHIYMHLHNNTTQQYPDIPVHKQTQYPDTIRTQNAHTQTHTDRTQNTAQNTTHRTAQRTLAQPQHRTVHTIIVHIV